MAEVLHWNFNIISWNLSRHICLLSLSHPCMHALSLSVYILYSMNDIHHLKLK